MRGELRDERDSCLSTASKHGEDLLDVLTALFTSVRVPVNRPV